MRQLKQENFKINNLEFEYFSYGNPGVTYMYNVFEDKATLLLSNFLDKEGLVKVSIKEPAKIDELVYNIIKHWKRNYKPDYKIFDSLEWKLNIELQDKTKYKFKGYHETPDNFDDLGILFKTIIKVEKAGIK